LALQQLLSEQEVYRILGEVSNEEEMLAALRVNAPDLVIIDYSQAESFSPRRNRNRPHARVEARISS